MVGSHSRASDEEQIYESKFYPEIEGEPRVLRNKLGITDYDTLERAEAGFVVSRLEEGLPDRAKTFDYEGFKAIHHHLLQDVYEWAGEERTYTTGRGQIPFAPPAHIERWMNTQFKILKEKNYLQGLEPAEFAKEVGDLVNEINAAHPFIDGNGRTQRVWLSIVAENAGYQLTIGEDVREQWNEAAKVGFETANSTQLSKVIESQLTRIRQLEHSPQPETDHARNYTSQEQDALREARKALQGANLPNTKAVDVVKANERVEGKLIGTSQDFYLVETNNKVLIGSKADLPQEAERGGNVRINAQHSIGQARQNDVQHDRSPLIPGRGGGITY